MLYPIPKSHLKANPQYLKYKINIVHLMFRFGSNSYQIHNKFLTSDILLLAVMTSKDQIDHYDEYILDVLFSENPFIRRNICEKKPFEERLMEVIFLIPGTELSFK